MKNDLLNNPIHNHLGDLSPCDPNLTFNVMDKWLKEAKEKHLPIKTVKYNKHKHKKNKWITYGLIKSIKSRDALYAEMKKKTPGDPEHAIIKSRLGTFNSILKKQIRHCKIEYYFNQFEKYKTDIKKTWKLISEIICKSNRKNYFDQDFLIDGKLVSNMEEIANKFHEFLFTDYRQ